MAGEPKTDLNGRRGPGRPPNTDNRRAILEATRAVLVSTGYERDPGGSCTTNGPISALHWLLGRGVPVCDLGVPAPQGAAEPVDLWCQVEVLEIDCELWPCA